MSKVSHNIDVVNLRSNSQTQKYMYIQKSDGLYVSYFHHMIKILYLVGLSSIIADVRPILEDN